MGGMPSLYTTKKRNNSLKTITPDGDHWFALKVFYNKVFEIEESLKEDGIDCYVPCEDAIVIRNGIKKVIRKPVISSILFFQSTTSRAMAIQRQFMDKVILYTRNRELKKVPLIIPDREMNIFMLVASSGEKGMEYLGADTAKFCRGERVRVIDGKFKGAEGYICRIKKNSRLVVAIQGVCAVATSYIPQSFLLRI